MCAKTTLRGADGLRRLAAVPALVALASIVQAQTPTPFGTTVEVNRVLTEVRVVDLSGEPVLGLTADDFRVWLGGESAQVESASIVQSVPPADTPGAVVRPDPLAPTTEVHSYEGRSIIIVVQTDFGLEPSRTVGVMRMAPRAADFIRRFGPNDRVALLTYGSRLRLLSDFTTDHRALADLMTTTELLDADAVPPRPMPPLLGDHLDSAKAERATQMIDGFELIGRALQPIPGTKSLVYLGYALGRDSSGPGMATGKKYEKAMAALTASRTSVFSLDITDADFHTLAFGLVVLSEDTGGFYTKTHELPDIAVSRLARVISSYYELSIIPPPDLEDSFKIKVKVDRPRVRVHTRQWHPSTYQW
jgi:VWFA-related protein